MIFFKFKSSVVPWILLGTSHRHRIFYLKNRLQTIKFWTKGTRKTIKKNQIKITIIIKNKNYKIDLKDNYKP